jgi:hypothetical protein
VTNEATTIKTRSGMGQVWFVGLFAIVIFLVKNVPEWMQPPAAKRIVGAWLQPTLTEEDQRKLDGYFSLRRNGSSRRHRNSGRFFRA